MEQDAPAISPYPISGDALALWSEIELLGLAAHVGELEIKGYTVVPPEKLAPLEFTKRMLQATLDAAQRRHGVTVSMGMTVETAPEPLKSPFGLPLVYGLFEDEVFQQAVLNPVVQALSTYLVGRNAVISEYGLLLKGPGGIDLDLHTDSFMMPDPLPAMPHICNLTWIMTDYSLENGSIAFVPGSHRYQRRPLANEGLDRAGSCRSPGGFADRVRRQCLARCLRARPRPAIAPRRRCTCAARTCFRRRAMAGRFPRKSSTGTRRCSARSWDASSITAGRKKGPAIITDDVFETIDMGKHAWD